MRAAIYLRVSTDEQTTDNQERELRATAERAGREVVAVYRDAGISGAKGRDKRPGFDAMHKDAARRRFDVVMAWSVDRLGRSLQDLIARSVSFPQSMCSFGCGEPCKNARDSLTMAPKFTPDEESRDRADALGVRSRRQDCYR